MAKKREQGFAATVESFSTIMRKLHLREYANIYILYGEEPFFIDKISEYIAQNAISAEEKDFNQEIVYGSETSASTVMEIARTFPMFSDRRVLVVREAAQMADFNKLEQYLENPVETTILVLCYKGKSLDKRLSFYKKAVNSGAVMFESVVARDYEIKGYLGEMIASHGCTIDAQAKELLVEHLGCDLKTIDNELTKLLSAMAVGDKRITNEHIEKYIGISKENNIFELTAALGEKNVKKVLSIAENFAQNPKNAPLVVTIPSIFKYFLTVFCVGMIIFDCKKRNKPMPSNIELSQRAKLPGAFFVDKYITASKIYPPSRAFQILGIIREYDMKSKGIGTGSLSDGELLKELLLKIVL